MKIYEKPMANIQTIDVQDVITTSAMTPEMAAAVTSSGVADATSANTIVFEW